MQNCRYQRFDEVTHLVELEGAYAHHSGSVSRTSAALGGGRGAGGVFCVACGSYGVLTVISLLLSGQKGI